MPLERTLKVIWALLLIGSIKIANACDSPENCVNSICHFEQGTPMCTNGCKAGYAGNLCKEHCNHNCTACERDDIERCTQCDKGYFGNRCERQCPNCLNSSCHLNGSCVEGCKASWWGPACTEACPNDCGDGCDVHSGVCIKDTTVTFLSSTASKTLAFSSSTPTQQDSTSPQTTKTVISYVTLTVVVACLVLLLVLIVLVRCVLFNLRHKSSESRREAPQDYSDNRHERLYNPYYGNSQGREPNTDVHYEEPEPEPERNADLGYITPVQQTSDIQARTVAATGEHYRTENENENTEHIGMGSEVGPSSDDCGYENQYERIEASTTF